MTILSSYPGREAIRDPGKLAFHDLQPGFLPSLNDKMSRTNRHACTDLITLAGCVPMSAYEKFGLSERERAILDFETSWWKIAAEKDQLIRERFHISPARYAQVIDGLTNNENAFIYRPFVVQRLRRERENRRLASYEVRLTAPQRQEN